VVEREVQKRLKRALEKLGCLVTKTHGNVYQSGVPDLIVVGRLRVLLIEVKGPQTPLKGAQVGFIKRAELLRCPAVAVFRGWDNGWTYTPCSGSSAVLAGDWDELEETMRAIVAGEE